MATIVRITRTVPSGLEMFSALMQIRNGIGKLKELDELRANAIGMSAAEMVSVFGLASEVDAQTINDRWDAFLSAYEDSGNAEYAKLRDLLAFVG